GVTLNDSQGHSGPNNFQNFPVLSSAANAGTGSTISGTFSEAGEPNATITLDFYASASGDPSGHGQGQTFLGSIQILTNNSGSATFAASLSVPLPAGERFISATATDAAGNTSEFSADLHYNFSGFLSPVSLNRAFKQGSSIPIKFQLTDASGN